MSAYENVNGMHVRDNRATLLQDSRAKETEVKVERKPKFLHLSLNLPITLADFFSILLELVERLIP